MREIKIGDEFFILKPPPRRVFRCDLDTIAFQKRIGVPFNSTIRVKGIYINGFVGVTFRLPGPLFLIHKTAFEDKETFDSIML